MAFFSSLSGKSLGKSTTGALGRAANKLPPILRGPGIVTAKASTTVLAAPTPENVTTVTSSQNNVNQIAPTGSVSRTTAVDLLTPTLGAQLNNAGTARLVTPPTILKTGNYRQRKT